MRESGYIQRAGNTMEHKFISSSGLFSKYGFSVLTLLVIVGRQEAAPNLTTIQTKAKDVDKYKPRNVAMDIVNITSVHLRWDHPKDASIKCPLLRYMIRLKTEGAKKSRTWKIDASRQSVTLHDLQADNTYYVRLLAVLCDGKGKPSRWLRVRTSESIGVDRQHSSDEEQELSAPGKPTYVRTRTFPDSVIVSWLSPDDSTLIRGYMIGYGEGVPDVNWQYVEAAKKNVTIKNLKPATQYIVSLRAFNNIGKGPVVYDLIYTRELPPSTAGPSTPPTDLRARILSPTTAWLQWVDPSLGRLQQLTDNRYYNVQYQASLPPDRALLSESSPGDAMQSKSLSVIVKALHLVLYDLVPGTRYEFKVRTVKDAQASQFSEAVVNTTYELEPGSPPRSLTVLGTNSSAVALASWRPPRLPNGEITGYFLFYTQSPEQSIKEWQLLSVAGNETEADITNLWPNKTYHFKVQAQNKLGYSPMSNTVKHYTSVHSETVPWKNSFHESISDTMLYNVTTSNNTHLPKIEFSQWNLREDSQETDSIETNYDYSDAKKRIIHSDHDDIDKYAKNDDEPHAEQLKYEDDQFHEKNSEKPFSTANDGKSKRAQNRREESPDGSISQGNNKHLADEIQVPFTSTLRYRISAYLTWPEKLQVCNTLSYNTPFNKSESDVIGYKLSYSRDGLGFVHQEDRTDQKIASMQVTEKTLTVNIAVLDELVPNSRYRYRIKYLFKGGLESPWSQEKTLETQLQS